MVSQVTATNKELSMHCRPSVSASGFVAVKVYTTRTSVGYSTTLHRIAQMLINVLRSKRKQKREATLRCVLTWKAVMNKHCFVGFARMPRAIKKKDAKQFGVDNSASSHDWMAAKPF